MYRSIGTIIALTLFIVGCQTRESNNRTSNGQSIVVVQENSGEVLSDKLDLRPSVGMMYYQGTPFTGVAVSYYPNGIPAEKMTYANGKREGTRTKWFESGQKSYEANYHLNRLDMEAISWWKNGHMRSQSSYTDGKSHGTQRQWYSNGLLFKELNIKEGKEEGLQRAWRENGKLFVNYEAKNGRIFGLKRASLCYELFDENIVFND